MDKLAGLLVKIRVQEFSCEDALNLITKILDVPACELAEEAQNCIADIFRSCKPPLCPFCNSFHSCTFRYLNNKKCCRSVQPRFLCGICKNHFTVGARRYNRRRSSTAFIQMPIAEDRMRCLKREFTGEALPFKYCNLTCNQSMGTSEYHFSNPPQFYGNLCVGYGLQDSTQISVDDYVIELNPFGASQGNPQMGWSDVINGGGSEPEKSSLISSELGKKCEVEAEKTTSDLIDCFTAEEIGSALQYLGCSSQDFDRESENPIWLQEF
ncbi:hypothetical protein SUGI_0072110 [Cryptomeria japonica]|nr:hypothetical protein SUGI_0072110 [Cryptomeria japonica]